LHFISQLIYYYIYTSSGSSDVDISKLSETTYRVYCSITNNPCNPSCKYFDIINRCPYEKIVLSGLTIGMIYNIVLIYFEKDYKDKKFLFNTITGKNLDDYIIDDNEYSYNQPTENNEINYKDRNEENKNSIYEYLIEIEPNKKAIIKIGFTNDNKEETHNKEYTFINDYYGYKKYITISDYIKDVLQDNIIYKYLIGIKYINRIDELKEFVKKFPDLPQSQYYKKLLNNECSLSDLVFNDFIEYIIFLITKAKYNKDIYKNKEEINEVLSYTILYLLYEYEPSQKGEFPLLYEYDSIERLNNIISSGVRYNIPIYHRFTNRRLNIFRYFKDNMNNIYFVWSIYNNISWLYLNYVWYDNNIKEIYTDTIKLFGILLNIYEKINLEFNSIYIILDNIHNPNIDICLLHNVIDNDIMKNGFINVYNIRQYFPEEFVIYKINEELNTYKSIVEVNENILYDNVKEKVSKIKEKLKNDDIRPYIIQQKSIYEILKEKKGLKKIECNK